MKKSYFYFSWNQQLSINRCNYLGKWTFRKKLWSNLKIQRIIKRCLLLIFFLLQPHYLIQQLYRMGTFYLLSILYRVINKQKNLFSKDQINKQINLKKKLLLFLMLSTWRKFLISQENIKYCSLLAVSLKYLKWKQKKSSMLFF